MRIGDLLIQAGFVTQQQVDAALKQQSSARKTPLGKHLLLLDYLTDAELELVLQAQRKIAFTTMTDQLAIASLKYAKLHRVDFETASRIVLSSFAQDSSKKITQPLPKPEQPQTPKADSSIGTTKITGSTARFSSNPDQLLKLSETAYAEKRFEESAKALEEVRTIYERSDGFSTDLLIPVYSRLAEIYSSLGKNSLAEDRVLKLIQVLKQETKLLPGSITAIAQVAHNCSRQGLNEQADKVYKVILPLWAKLLPFEQSQFPFYLRDAISSSRTCQKATNKNIRIGELLVESKILEADQFQDALQKSKRLRQPLGKVLSESGLVRVQDLRNAMRVQLMCRAAVIPVEYAAFTVIAASCAKESVDIFFKSFYTSFENPAALLLPELIEKMDKLLVLEEKLGIKNPEVASLAVEVADICLRRNETEEAELMLRRAHAVFAVESETYRLDLANTCYKIARLLQAKNKYEEAELLLMQSMEIRNRLLGDKDPELAEVLIELGSLYIGQGNYLPAAGFLKSAWAIIAGKCEAEKSQFVLKLLIKCYEQMGIESECNIYRQQLPNY